VSSPERPVAAAAVSAGGGKPLWKTKAGERTVFRHPVPLVVWWGWTIFALANLIDVAVSGHLPLALKVTAGLLLATGLVYACTVQSRVEADADGVTIFNPLRQHRAPWGALEGIYLGDSIEFACSRPTPKKTKKIYSWALYSGRRSRARARLQRGPISRGRAAGSGYARPGTLNPRAPAEAAELARQPSAQLMAAELGSRLTAARDSGAPAAVLASRWSWRPVAAIIGPAVLLVVLLPLH
jgi:hypothetical protein